MSSDQPIEVVNDREAGRLEVKLDGQTAFSEYRVTPKGVIFRHTETPKAFQGRGVASAIVRAGLQFARDEKLKVIPICPFFVSYLARHPQYWDQVHPDYLETVKAAKDQDAREA
ncbi:MAG TPA: GNAT family N-acetyltransferase [Caulobacteraceae bacterium]